jgi:hypothetical protein
MPITMDARQFAYRGEDAHLPVTTAIYTVQFVMNEDDPDALGANHMANFSAEIQRVMDEADFTTALRYDAVNFEVVSRIVISTTTNEDN